MKEQLQEQLQKRVEQCITHNRKPICDKIEKKKETLNKRQAEIVKVKAKGEITLVQENIVHYKAHFQYLIKQKDHMYIEEEIEERKAEYYKNKLVHDYEINHYLDIPVVNQPYEDEGDNDERISFVYDRRSAVKYAERWWNEYNPAFKKFDVDCTNYISQCLYAGDAPMVGYPNRSNGWWMRNQNWSFTWTVANSLRWYLPRAKQGIRAIEVKNPEELEVGDVICYDFQGDGRFDHTTIVTGHDLYGMPLVNAHTANSRMRYWAYEDSTAYTPKMSYRFMHILDDQS